MVILKTSQNKLLLRSPHKIIENNRIKAEKESNWWKGKQAEVDKRNYKTIN